MSPEVIEALKRIAFGAAFAALAYIGVALGADPALNASPTMGAFGGFIAGVITRFVAARKTESDIVVEVVPLEAVLQAQVPSSFDRPGGTTGSMGGL